MILVERSGYAIFVGIKYENLPDFCVNYQHIDHALSNCENRMEFGAKCTRATSSRVSC